MDQKKRGTLMLIEQNELLNFNYGTRYKVNHV